MGGEGRRFGAGWMREGREDDRRIFQGTRVPRGEERTDALGWTEERISQRKGRAQGPPQKGGSEKDERGGRRGEQTGRREGEGEKDEGY